MTIKLSNFRSIERPYPLKDSSLNMPVAVLLSGYMEAAMALQLFQVACDGIPDSAQARSRLTEPERHAPHFMAEIFARSVHRVGRLLYRINQQSKGLFLTQELAEFHSLFPGLTGLRDSHEHIDERAFFRKRKLPLDGPMISGMLAGRTFISTDEDGNSQSIDVGEATLELLYDLAKRAVASLTGAP